MKTSDLYWKKDPMEVEWFIDLMDKFPDMEFFQPSPEKAPWHVQCRLDNGELMDFWPHVQKAMIHDEPPVVKWPDEIEVLVHEARARMPDDFEVIE